MALTADRRRNLLVKLASSGIETPEGMKRGWGSAKDSGTKKFLRNTLAPTAFSSKRLGGQSAEGDGFRPKKKKKGTSAGKSASMMDKIIGALKRYGSIGEDQGPPWLQASRPGKDGKNLKPRSSSSMPALMASLKAQGTSEGPRPSADGASSKPGKSTSTIAQMKGLSGVAGKGLPDTLKKLLGAADARQGSIIKIDAADGRKGALAAHAKMLVKAKRRRLYRDAQESGNKYMMRALASQGL
jgi:hypothetical protein